MDMQQMMQQLLVNAKANKEATQTKLQANRGSDPEKLKGVINANLTYLKDIKSSQAEMRSTICAFRSELKETIEHEMKAVIQPIRAELDETTDCNGATETEPDPGMMQSIEEH
jgi:hypothetical protein